MDKQRVEKSELIDELFKKYEGKYDSNSSVQDDSPDERPNPRKLLDLLMKIVVQKSATVQDKKDFYYTVI